MRPFVSCWVLVLTLPGVLVVGCGGSGENGNGGSGGSGGAAGSGGSAGNGGGALRVVETRPANADVDVDTDTAVDAVFDDELQVTTVTADAFTLRSETDTVQGAVSLAAADTAVFTPDNPLALLSRYTATVTTALESPAGGSLGADHAWMFTTRDGSWADPEVMVKANPGRAAWPSVAVNAEGTAFAVWEESSGMVYSSWASRYTPTGGWETPEALGNAGRFPHVAADADGNAIATWRQSNGIRFDGWVNRYTPIGGWGTPELIETDNGTQTKRETDRLC